MSGSRVAPAERRRTEPLLCRWLMLRLLMLLWRRRRPLCLLWGRGRRPRCWRRLRHLAFGHRRRWRHAERRQRLFERPRRWRRRDGLRERLLLRRRFGLFLLGRLLRGAICRRVLDGTLGRRLDARRAARIGSRRGRGRQAEADGRAGRLGGGGGRRRGHGLLLRLGLFGRRRRRHRRVHRDVDGVLEVLDRPQRRNVEQRQRHQGMQQARQRHRGGRHVLGACIAQTDVVGHGDPRSTVRCGRPLAPLRSRGAAGGRLVDRFRFVDAPHARPFDPAAHA